MNASTRITYAGVPGSGIEMLPGTSDHFTSALTAFAGSDTVSTLQAILPYSVIISNQTSSGLIAIVVRLDLTDAAGQSVWNQTVLASRTKERQEMVLPGEMALMTPVPGLSIRMRKGAGPAAIRATTDLAAQVAKKARSFDAKSEVAITLDLLVFEDGSAIGPDIGHNIEHMNLWRDAERSVVTGVLTRAPGERAAFLERIINAPEKPIRSLDEEDHFDSAKRRTARLMVMYIGALPNEVELSANLDYFLQSQMPQLHRRDK